MLCLFILNFQQCSGSTHDRGAFRIHNKIRVALRQVEKYQTKHSIKLEKVCCYGSALKDQIEELYKKNNLDLLFFDYFDIACEKIYPSIKNRTDLNEFENMIVRFMEILEFEKDKERLIIDALGWNNFKKTFDGDYFAYIAMGELLYWLKEKNILLNVQKLNSKELINNFNYTDEILKASSSNGKNLKRGKLFNALEEKLVYIPYPNVRENFVKMTLHLYRLFLNANNTESH